MSLRLEFFQKSYFQKSKEISTWIFVEYYFKHQQELVFRRITVLWTWGMHSHEVGFIHNIFLRFLQGAASLLTWIFFLNNQGLMRDFNTLRHMATDNICYFIWPKRVSLQKAVLDPRYLGTKSVAGYLLSISGRTSVWPSGNESTKDAK